MADLDRSPEDVSKGVVSGGNTQNSMMDFSEDEEKLIARMYNLVGQRWSLIAGRIPGRTAKEIEKIGSKKLDLVHTMAYHASDILHSNQSRSTKNLSKLQFPSSILQQFRNTNTFHI
ncbi:hypothetical protein OPV22_031969 [Ensete ventricosum]|uniref:Myb-like domain-containing protein n=1 Tax=Ensete ventricosum TaxID=4639 RepID=A0AAV8PQD5_ENSVE|nr:hypothetical protein OPV22_031969 [Ensete ventricosum]